MRTLTAFATAWRLAGGFRYDWLVESVVLGIHWSYRTEDAGGHTWEHRLYSISAIEQSVPPGGGLGSAQTCTIEAIQNNAGTSLRTLWDTFGRVEGADIRVFLLPFGEDYADRIPYFTGVIDHSAWRAGVTSGAGIGTLVGVSTETHRDIQLPATTLTAQAYPTLPDQWRGATLPLIYGAGSVLNVAPLLLLDPTALTYRAADHALGSMGTTHAVAVGEGTRVLALAGAATSIALDAALTLTKPVTELRYEPGGQTQVVTHAVNVSNSANLIDGNPATLAGISTSTLDGDGNGHGRLAVKYTWTNPDGANTALITLGQHRRNAGGLTTCTMEVLVRSLNAATNAIQRDGLFQAGPYQHQSNPRTTLLTVPSLALAPGAALEVELSVTNDGGVGTAAEHWQIGDLTTVLYFQADTLFSPVYLSPPWDGRADPDGSLTGTVGAIIRHPAGVLQSVLVQLLGLPVHGASFSTVKSALVTHDTMPFHFDFGLGSGGWYRSSLSAVELLDTLAWQAGCYLFPTGDGSHALRQVRPTAASSVLHLDLSNIDDAVPIELGRLEMVHNTIEVHYAWSVTLGRFTKVALATPGVCNHPTPAIASDLLLKCSDSNDRYGPQSLLRVEAYAIQEDGPAFTQLQRLVNYFWTQQLLVTCETTFVGIHLEVGDFVDITHPELPETISGGLFEVIRLTTIPEVPNARPYPLRLTAIAATRTTFDYFRILDQSGVTWYWWVTRGGTLDWALAPPTIATRLANELVLSPVPSWLTFGGTLGATIGFADLLFLWRIPLVSPPETPPLRYLRPTVFTGGPEVVFIEPSVGEGYIGSPTLRGMGAGEWRISLTTGESWDVMPV